MCKPSCYSKYNNKHLGAIQHVQYHWGKNCCGGKVSTNQCSYYFPFVVNFLSEDEDWWIPRVLLCVLMGNYWSLLPLVSASICWSAHESPTAWIIEMTQLSLMKFEPQSKTLLDPWNTPAAPLYFLSGSYCFVCFTTTSLGRALADSDAKKLEDTYVFTDVWAHNNCSNFDNDALWIMTLQLSVHLLNCV